MGHYRMIPDKSVEILLGELSRDIAQRTPGTDDFPTAVEGLELFRRNEPAPPVSCLVPPSIVLVADGAKIMWVGGEPYEYNAEIAFIFVCFCLCLNHGRNSANR